MMTFLLLSEPLSPIELKTYKKGQLNVGRLVFGCRFDYASKILDDSESSLYIKENCGNAIEDRN